MQRGKTPYSKLGQKLTQLRKELQETLPEVSGAVELDTEIIASYERGETRPSEDVLSMLITHFDIPEDEAEELWELAGYLPASDPTPNMPLQTMIVIPVENKIIYSDNVKVEVNKQGVVVSFSQDGVSGQPALVSRIGMSLDQAKKVSEVLSDTIKRAENAGKPKQLPAKTDES